MATGMSVYKRVYARYALWRGWTERWLSLHTKLSWRDAQLVWRLYRAAHHRWWTGEESATGPAITLPVPGNSPMKVTVRPGTSDIMVYCDVLVDRVYVRFVPDPPVVRVLDIGANVGLASVLFLTAFPQCQVVAVEPDPSNAAICRANLAGFGSRAKVVEAAVWSEEARVSVGSKHAGTWASSVIADSQGPIEGQTMPVLLDLLGGRADIVKIDVEGAEQAVFEAADTSWIDDVRWIAVEPEHEASFRAFERAIARRMHIVARYRDVVFAGRPG